MTPLQLLHNIDFKGFTVKQTIILMLLNRGNMSITAMSKELDRPSVNIINTVRDLEMKGYVSRLPPSTKPEDDQRIKPYYLTSNGREVVNNLLSEKKR